MPFIRFPLSLRNVKDVLHKPGIEMNHETGLVASRRTECLPQKSETGLSGASGRARGGGTWWGFS